MTSKKYLRLQVLCIFCVVLFSLLDIYMYKKGYFEEKQLTLKYQETNDIDYKVYLKENDFFETDYLGKNKTYITSLIDYINVDYNYNIEFDHPVTGDYQYYVYATIESKKTNSDDKYWSKDYTITDTQTMNITDLKEYSIHENVNIDYNKYNSILNSFKKTVGLSSSDGILKVYLKVNNNIKGNGIESPIESKLLLQLPLSEMTIEASINLDEHNTVKEISKPIDSDKLSFQRTIGSIYLAAIISCLVLTLYFNKKRKSLNKYDNTLKKILNTYDGIIVNIKKLPLLANYKVIDVSSFDELLDAHSEVRMPINFYQEDDKCYFLLITDNTAWRYGMKRIKK